MPILDDELRFLVRRHPRATWQGHASFGEVARLQGDSTNPAPLRPDLGQLKAQSAPAGAPVRRLDDEEDLVVPLILEQGERTLFAHT